MKDEGHGTKGEGYSCHGSTVQTGGSNGTEPVHFVVM